MFFRYIFSGDLRFRNVFFFCRFFEGDLGVVFKDFLF